MADPQQNVTTQAPVPQPAQIPTASIAIWVVFAILLLVIVIVGIFAYLLLWRRVRDLQRQISRRPQEIQSVETPIPSMGQPNGYPTKDRSIQETPKPQPRFSLMVGEQTLTDVIGYTGDLAVLQGLSQLYQRDTIAEKRRTQLESVIEDVIIPVENIELTYKGPTRQINLSYSNIKAKHHGKRPKSIALPKDVPTANPTDSFPGMVIQEIVGPQGGTVSIGQVELMVPAGAVERPVTLSLGVIWESKFNPLKPGDPRALLSPIVICEPQGLQFQKAVTLRIPHCAADVHLDWNVQALMSDSNVSQSPTWEAMSGQDSQVQDHHVVIQTMHFTLYTLVGESRQEKVAAKLVVLVAFAPLFRGDPVYRIRTYCVDSHEGDKKSMFTTEGNRWAEQLDAPKPFMFAQTGKDLVVKLEDLQEGWKLHRLSKTEYVLDYELIWHGAAPNCSFICEQKGSADQISCLITGFQIGNEAKKERLEIVQMKKITPVPWSHMDFPPFPRAQPTKFPLILRQSLTKLLDPESPDGCSDWVLLADKLGLDVTEVRYLRATIGTAQGPTERLLERWEESELSVKDFIDLMKQGERLDVVEKVEKWENETTVRPQKERMFGEEKGDRESKL